MKITLFGAAFDPPHRGHQKIACSLLEQHLADAVWFLPVKEHAFGKKLASEGDRLTMVELLADAVRDELENSGTVPDSRREANNVEMIRVETYELTQSGTSYTYLTLSALAKLYPQHQFSFVIGSDNLARFHEWPHYLDMPLQFPFFVYPRDGFPLTPLYPGMVVMEHVQPVAVSSTLVRQQVQQNNSISGLVSNSIEKYLQDSQLYRGKTDTSAL
jgi:nicotinate-nucleotide adenylyltransferase